ncbi:UNVERIFIED_CONTAM: hypothetical protein FKN15_044529 [Acipenser sinensis]
MDRNALAELLQALESRRDAEERRREERYTALIERVGLAVAAATTPTTTPSAFLDVLEVREVLVESENQQGGRNDLRERNRESGEHLGRPRILYCIGQPSEPAV